jgi:hypothetical protein
MAYWYVCYAVGTRKVLEPSANESLAIDVACRLLDRGRNVLEVGSMLAATPTVDSAEIRRICEGRCKPH